jgi:hypothetical protein
MRQAEEMAAPPIRLTIRISIEENPMQRMQFVLLAALWGCADRETELGLHVDELHRDDGTSISVACESDEGAISRRSCVLGSDGHYFALGGDEAIVVPAEPPYGAYVEFADGFVLDPEGLATEGEAAHIQALVTPSSAQGENAADRVPVSAEITREGGLLLIVEEEVPASVRVNIILESLEGMFSSWPEGSPCPDGGLGCMGYAFRFFVGEAPQNSPVSATTDGQATQAEASP